MKIVLSIFLVIFCCFSLFAQKQFTYQLQAVRAKGSIELDGKLNEDTWLQSPKITNFFQNFPYDTSFAKLQTEVFTAFDKNFFYIAAVCYQPQGTYVVTSLRRDFGKDDNDYFAVFIDTFQDKTNGFAFLVSPYNVQYEGLISDGGVFSASSDWDNKWYSQVKQYEDKWIVEMAIPLKTLRYKKNTSEWNINFARSSRAENEISTWVPVGRNFRITNLGFAGKLKFEEPLPSPGANVVVIPYVTGNISENYVTQNKKIGANAGADAKIAVTPSLNLDLTINPDFSQVEVDRQVTNLDRFEIFFPERRQFFLENADLFARFGFSRIRPFFSRRIGIGFDTTSKTIVQNPILYGARLSGKTNEYWRIGLLNMQTANQKDRGIYGDNFTVAAVQRTVFKRSNIAGIFVNRQRTADTLSDFSFNNQNFNRLVGIDYNILSVDNRWNGKVFYHQQISPNPQKDQFAHAAFINYTTPNWSIAWNHEYVGKNYQINDIGFVPRNDLYRFEPLATRNFFPKGKWSKKIVRIQFMQYNNFYWDTQWQLNDRSNSISGNILFQNTAFFSTSFRNTYTRLFFPFDPTNTGGNRLPTGSEFTNNYFDVFYRSDRRKLLVYSFAFEGGEYYNGRQLAPYASISYRYQPFGQISLEADYRHIRLPEGYNSADLLLLNLRTDVSFTTNLFLTIFLQYNTQTENVNLNGRLQWRFAPVSDVFLVYTDNYLPQDFSVKSRFVVIKATYWLNL